MPNELWSAAVRQLTDRTPEAIAESGGILARPLRYEVILKP
jgi:hypothetical protein